MKELLGIVGREWGGRIETRRNRREGSEKGRYAKEGSEKGRYAKEGSESQTAL
jgi:hypothetical protein